MNKLNNIFTENIVQKKKLVIPYIMIGDGGLDESYKLLDLYIQSGAKIIELGVPFSDATADGLTIQASGKRALENKITLSIVFEFLDKASSMYNNVSFVVMTYINPIVHYGIDKFFNSLNMYGASGIIIPDLPIEEYNLIYKQTQENSIAIIPLISLDTDIERIRLILSKSSGFVYAVTLKGITGTKDADEILVAELFKKIRSISNLPVIAGFGIKTELQIKRMTKIFDGVIIASKLIDLAQDKNYVAISKIIGCI